MQIQNATPWRPVPRRFLPSRLISGCFAAKSILGWNKPHSGWPLLALCGHNVLRWKHRNGLKQRLIMIVGLDESKTVGLDLFLRTLFDAMSYGVTTKVHNERSHTNGF